MFTLTVTDAGTLGGHYSLAAAIDNQGQVAGRSTLPDGRRHAFLWQSDTGMQDLGALDASGCSGANGLNDAGVAVGWTQPSPCDSRSPSHAVFWDKDGIHDLGTLPAVTQAKLSRSTTSARSLARPTQPAGPTTPSSLTRARPMNSST